MHWSKCIWVWVRCQGVYLWPCIVGSDGQRASLRSFSHASLSWSEATPPSRFLRLNGVEAATATRTARRPNIVSSIDMEHLKESEFKSWFTVEDYLTSCRQAFELYGRGEIVNPRRREEVGDGYFRLEMRAEWKGRYRVCKVIEERSDVGSGRLGERVAVIELEDLRDGGMVTVEADHITDMRTGAAGALGVEFLARDEVRRVGILGTGRVARVLAVAVDRLFSLEGIRATSRSQEKRDAFAAEVQPQISSPLTMVGSLDECVKGVDAVLTAVPTPEPILTVDQVREIPVLVVMGGDGRTRQLDAKVLEEFPLLVDHEEQVAESGEFRHARESARYERVRFAGRGDGAILTVGDAACGGLATAAERPRVLYYTGLAAQDLCAAAMIYEGSRRRQG